jgi:hypothetical protein
MSRATIFTVEEDDDEYVILLPKKRRLPLVGGSARIPDHLLTPAERARRICGRFVADALIRDTGSRVSNRQMLEAFERWRQMNDETALSDKAVASALKALGLKRIRSNGVLYVDVALAQLQPPEGWTPAGASAPSEAMEAGK